MAKTIIEALKKYFEACPLLAGSKINVDYLPDKVKTAGVECSIDTTPAEEEIQRYVSGSAMCQQVFDIRTLSDYGPDTLQQVANSGFFEDLSAWLREQTKKKNLPELPDGMTARFIEAQSTGYLAADFADKAKYQIQCRLVYFRKGER